MKQLAPCHTATPWWSPDKNSQFCVQYFIFYPYLASSSLTLQTKCAVPNVSTWLKCWVRAFFKREEWKLFLIRKLSLKSSEKEKEGREDCKEPQVHWLCQFHPIIYGGSRGRQHVHAGRGLVQYAWFGPISFIFHNSLESFPSHDFSSHFHCHITLKPIPCHHMDWFEPPLFPNVTIPNMTVPSWGEWSKFAQFIRQSDSTHPF